MPNGSTPMLSPKKHPGKNHQIKQPGWLGAAVSCPDEDGLAVTTATKQTAKTKAKTFMVGNSKRTEITWVWSDSFISDPDSVILPTTCWPAQQLTPLVSKRGWCNTQRDAKHDAPSFQSSTENSSLRDVFKSQNYRPTRVRCSNKFCSLTGLKGQKIMSLHYFTFWNSTIWFLQNFRRINQFWVKTLQWIFKKSWKQSKFRSQFWSTSNHYNLYEISYAYCE